METIIYPSKSRHIVSEFGALQINDKKSDGIKFNCPLLSQVFAVADGIVVELNNESAYGKYIVIQHKKICSVYANLNSIYVTKGIEIKQGDVIANTGIVNCFSKPYLYFEIRTGHYNNAEFWDCDEGQFANAIDPTKYLKKSKDWRLTLGKKALNNLHNKGIISEPERWELGLLGSLPSWIIWEVFNRIVNRVGID